MAQSVSMLEAAYKILKDKKDVKAIAFDRLFEQACAKAGIEEEVRESKKASFYTSLMLDSRFTNTGNHSWNLSSRINKSAHDTFVKDLDADQDEGLKDMIDENFEEDSEEDEIREDIISDDNA